MNWNRDDRYSNPAYQRLQSQPIPIPSRTKLLPKTEEEKKRIRIAEENFFNEVRRREILQGRTPAEWRYETQQEAENSIPITLPKLSNLNLESVPELPK